MPDDLPYPVWSGTFMLHGVELKCHVLNTGERVIEAESMEALFSALDQPGAQLDPAELEVFARWRLGGS